MSMDANEHEKPNEPVNHYFNNGPDSSPNMAAGAFERIRTTGSITLSPEQFERLYLQPFEREKVDPRKTFGEHTSMQQLVILKERG